MVGNHLVVGLPAKKKAEICVIPWHNFVALFMLIKAETCSATAQKMETPWMHCLLLLVQPLLLLHAPGVAAKVPALVVFGDSSVDTGNNDYLPTVARSNFEPYGRDFNGGVATGRFSNGRLATDFISQDFGLPDTVPAYLDPSFEMKDFATGVCFASAATGYDNVTSDVLVSLQPQPIFLLCD